MICFQESVPASASGLVETLQHLGWIDKTALGVLLVFCVLGLFKGLIWQVSRIGILVAAYLVAGRFGHDVAAMLDGATGDVATGAGPAGTATAAGGAAAEAGSTSPWDPAQAVSAAEGAGSTGPGETTIYLAYCLLFVAVLIVLSLIAMVIKKLVDKAGLGFFDRIGGGVLGVATGACVVLAMVFAINMFFPQSELARAAESSHSQRLSRRAIDWLGRAVDDDLRGVLALHPLNSPAPGPDGRPAPSPADPGSPEYHPPMPTPLPLPENMQQPTPERGDNGSGARRGGIR